MKGTPPPPSSDYWELPNLKKFAMSTPQFFNTPQTTEYYQIMQPPTLLDPPAII